MRVDAPKMMPEPFSRAVVWCGTSFDARLSLPSFTTFVPVVKKQTKQNVRVSCINKMVFDKTLILRKYHGSKISYQRRVIVTPLS